MILKCEKCGTQYNLPDEKIGDSGRMVRCVSCSHTWFQKLEQEAVDESSEVKNQASDKDDEFDVDIGEMESDDIFGGESEEGIKEEDIDLEKVEAIESDDEGLAVITHNPFGVGSRVFGMLMFTLLISLTLLALVIFKPVVLNSVPEMALFYKSVGFSTDSPEQAIRFSDLKASVVSKDGNDILMLEGKVKNITKEKVEFPQLAVVLKDKSNKDIKTWDIAPKSKEIDSGGFVPIKLGFKEAPKDGVALDLRVKD